jgi:hypothetical protein
MPNDDRIVLLYTTKNGDVTHVAGRALSDTKLRYLTIKVGKVEHKTYGIHHLDFTTSAVVVEGQFDSMLLRNCVASGDSNLTAVCEMYPDVDWTVVYDNEPRNKDIVKQLERTINKGYKVVIFPDSIEQKDINDMVLAGVDVETLIRDNTHQGPKALLKFMKWKRV